MQGRRGFIGIVTQSTDPVPRPLVVVSAAVALSLLGDQMLYAILPVVHEAVGIPVISVGLLLSANRLVRLLTNSLAGYVIERCGRQWPFVLALLLGGLTTMAYGMLYGMWAFLVVRLLWGTAWSFIRIEGLSTVLDVASNETRGRYMGLFQAISRLGSAVAMLAGGILADLMGFRPTFILFGSLTCLAAFLLHVEMSSRGAPGSPTRPERTASRGPLRGEIGRLRNGTLWRGADRRMRWRMVAANFGTFSTYLVIGGLVSATLGYMLHLRFGPAPILGPLTIGVASLTGILLSSRGFLDLSFAPFAGYLADCWGRHRMIYYALPLAVLMVGSLGLFPSLPVVMAVVLVMFAAWTALNVAFNAVAGDIAPPGGRSMFLGLFVTGQDLGAAVGPLLGYWIGPAFGLAWLYVCGAVILFLASMFYLTTFVERPVVP